MHLVRTFDFHGSPTHLVINKEGEYAIPRKDILRALGEDSLASALLSLGKTDPIPLSWIVGDEAMEGIENGGDVLLNKSFNIN